VTGQALVELLIVHLGSLFSSALISERWHRDDVAPCVVGRQPGNLLAQRGELW
jgi:hypothetical protein